MPTARLQALPDITAALALYRAIREALGSRPAPSVPPAGADGLDRGQVGSLDRGLELRQRNGERVCVCAVGRGRYDVVVRGERGIVSAMTDLDIATVSRLAEEYSWRPNP